MVKWDSVRTSCELRLAPLSFGVANQDSYLMEARKAPVASAREKAQLLAEQNGLKLGSATLIYDDSPDITVAPGLTIRPRPSSDDPFGATLPTETRGYSPAIRLVALHQDLPENMDIDHPAPHRSPLPRLSGLCLMSPSVEAFVANLGQPGSDILAISPGATAGLSSSAAPARRHCWTSQQWHPATGLPSWKSNSMETGNMVLTRQQRHDPSPAATVDLSISAQQKAVACFSDDDMEHSK